MKRITLVVAVLVLFTGMLFAQPPAATDNSQPTKGGPGMIHRQVIDEQMVIKPGCGMNLTEDQQNKMKVLRKAHQREMLQMKSDLQSANVDLKLAMTADKYDNSKVDAAINKISDLKKKMLIAKTKHQKAVRDLLTPEQQMIFDQKILKGKGCGMGCGGGCGMGPGKGMPKQAKGGCIKMMGRGAGPMMLGGGCKWQPAEE